MSLLFKESTAMVFLLLKESIAYSVLTIEGIHCYRCLLLKESTAIGAYH